MVGCNILPLLDPTLVPLALHCWLKREVMVRTRSTTLDGSCIVRIAEQWDRRNRDPCISPELLMLGLLCNREKIA